MVGGSPPATAHAVPPASAEVDPAAVIASLLEPDAALPRSPSVAPGAADLADGPDVADASIDPDRPDGPGA